MGRRRSYPHEKSAIGDSYVDDAVTQLRQTARITAAVMAEYPHTREATLPMIFSADVLEKMEAVKGMIEPSSIIAHYDVDDGDSSFIINYDGAKVPTVSPKFFKPDPVKAATLLSYIKQVEAIYNRFEEVVTVLTWLNKNATIGAIRYYWPSALQLCPNSPALKEMQHVPTRFTTPPGITDYLQMMKDSAATVAGSLLLPATAKPRPASNMWLYFPNGSNFYM